MKRQFVLAAVVATLSFNLFETNARAEGSFSELEAILGQDPPPVNIGPGGQKQCLPPKEEMACTALCPIIVETSGELGTDPSITEKSLSVFEHYDPDLKRSTLVGTLTCEVSAECEGEVVDIDASRPPSCKQPMDYLRGCEGIVNPGDARSITVRETWELPVSWTTLPSPEILRSLLKGETFYVSGWCKKSADKHPEDVPELSCEMAQHPTTIESFSGVGCGIKNPNENPGGPKTLPQPRETEK